MPRKKKETSYWTSGQIGERQFLRHHALFPSVTAIIIVQSTLVYILELVTIPNANRTCTDPGVKIIICVLSHLFSQVLASAALLRQKTPLFSLFSRHDVLASLP
jgi:hypothetical protein